MHQIALFSRDPKVIRDQIFAVLIAGRDTTAATLSWAMYEISAQPAIWQRLREETLNRLGEDGDPTYEDLKGLTYLNHTLNETLRLYPAVPYNLRSCRTFCLSPLCLVNFIFIFIFLNASTAPANDASQQSKTPRYQGNPASQTLRLAKVT